MSIDASAVWQEVKLKGGSLWWPMEARRLNAANGAAPRLSATSRDAEANKELRARVLKWYGLR